MAGFKIFIPKPSEVVEVLSLAFTDPSFGLTVTADVTCSAVQLSPKSQPLAGLYLHGQ